MSWIVKTMRDGLTNLGLADITIGYLLLLFIFIFVLMKLFHFWFNRKIDREEQQFEVVNRFIDEEGYLEKVKAQPQIFRQVVFRRIYWLRNFPLKEIDYLIKQSEIPYTIYELSELKKASLLKFSEAENEYIFITNTFNDYWVNNYWRCIFSSLALFMVLAISVSLIKVFTQSMAIFIIALVALIVLEVWLINTITAIKMYIRISKVDNR